MIRKLLAIPVLAAGVGIAAWMVSTRGDVPERAALAELRMDSAARSRASWAPETCSD